MANSPILGIPLLSNNQSAKETTINDAIAFLEKSTNAAQTLDFASGDIVLPLLDMQRFFFFKFANVTEPRELTVPAGERIFCVDNTGNSEPVTIVRDADSVEVSAGAACMVAVSGTDILFLANSAVGGSIPFTSLSDAPSSYSGHGSKFLRVNSGGTALEFADSGDSLADFIQLGDVPNAYTDAAGWVVKVNGTANGLTFAPLTFVGMGDTPVNYADAANLYVRVNPEGNGLIFGEAGELLSLFIQLTDTPVSYAGQAGKLVAVAEGENGLVFVSATGGGTSSFVGLEDTPEAYEGSSGMFVRVNNDGTGLIFAPAGDSLADFIQLGDVPESYETFGGKFLRVSVEENGVTFGGAGLTDLDDFMDDYEGKAGYILRVTSGEDGVEAVSPAVLSRFAINTQSGSYTLTISDADRSYVRMTSATAADLTVPPNSDVAFPVGTTIAIRAAGEGVITVVAGSGVTVNTSETLTLRAQHSGATLVKVATDEWDIIGDMEIAA